ncbi:MAG: SseB family protein [Microbacteriaceae bacterium]
MSQPTDHGTDSAGQPWAGRQFQAGPASTDDGSAPESLIQALRRFHDGTGSNAEVVDVLRGTRLLIPLVAHLGESGTDDAGHRLDKTQELAIVTVAGPDGRDVLPVFSSVTALQTWNPRARPVPADGVRVALAAASERTDLVVLDPTSETEFVVRRPALWAMARAMRWAPSYADAAVARVFQESAAGERAVIALTLAPGDPMARLAGPELLVRLELEPGLVQSELNALLDRLQACWAASTVIAQHVDSMAVKVLGSSTRQ